MNTLNQINSFLAPKKLIVVGVSRRENKFGRMVYDHLVKNGYEVCPVNAKADEINGARCYHSVGEAPVGFDKVLIVTPQEQTLDVLKQVSERGQAQVWVQQTSENKEVMDYISQHEIDAICKKCIFMFAEPVKGGHKFHRAIMKLFRLYPN